MKIMALTRKAGDTLTVPPIVDVIPDSALIMPGKPTFLPDFSNMWTMVAYPAFRVSRLGKNISPKFAPRYYDAVTLALRICPMDMVDELKRCPDGPGGLAGLIDNCLTLGEWQALPANGSDKLTFNVGAVTVESCLDEMMVDKALSLISSYATLKIGDILMPCMFSIETMAEVGMSIDGSINKNKCLSVKIR